MASVKHSTPADATFSAAGTAAWDAEHDFTTTGLTGPAGATGVAGGVKYDTSRIMSNACAEVINTFRLYPIFGVFHGRGLQQALVDEEYALDNVALAGTPKANMVRGYKAIIMPMPEAA